MTQVLILIALCEIVMTSFSGGSRISRRARWPLGGVDLRHGHFSVKMDAKTKELGPVGGCTPGSPPRSANIISYSTVKSQNSKGCGEAPSSALVQIAVAVNEINTICHHFLITYTVNAISGTSVNFDIDDRHPFINRWSMHGLFI